MTPCRTLGLLCAVAVAWLVHAQPVRAQEPSPAATALGREVVELKGGMSMFDTVVSGVIEHHRRLLLQMNPNLDKDLTDVANQLQAEFVPRLAEIHAEIARAYAIQFTEAELRQIVAFYKTPLGKKLITAEPAALDEATKRVDAWATKFADEVMLRLRAEMKKKGHPEL